jgi:type I restriction enzyme S subunit
MKDSGAEWFTEIPSDWEVVSLGRLIWRAVDGPHHSPKYLDQGVPFLSARNVKADSWSLGDVKFISEEDFNEFSRRVVPEIGDVLLTKGGTTGVARVVDLPFRFQVWVHIAVLKVQKHLVDPEYLALALNSPHCYEQSQLLTRGATNQDLGLSRMKRVQLTLPPTLMEQSKIVAHARTSTSALSAKIQRAEREIDLIREFRGRLISDVVTGKLDIQKESALLPEAGPIAVLFDDTDDLEEFTADYVSDS